MSVLIGMAHTRPGRRAKLLALAALELVVEKLDGDPVAPSLELRALLAFLYFSGNGERWPFDRFWRNLVDPYDGQTETARKYMRPTHGRSLLQGIRRASMADGNDYHRAIWKIVTQHRQTADPEYAQRKIASDAVRLAAAVGTLETTKGVPKSVGSARLAAYMRAHGGSPEGFDPKKASEAPIVNDGSECGWL